MDILKSLKLIWIFYRKIYLVYLLALILIFSFIFKSVPENILFDVSMHTFFSITGIFTIVIASLQAKKVFALSSFKVARVKYWTDNLIFALLNSLLHLLIFLVFVFKFNFDLHFVMLTCFYYLVSFLTINTLAFLACYERTNLIILITMGVLLVIYINLLYILYAGNNMNSFHTILLFFGTLPVALINLVSIKYIDIC